MDHTLDTPQPIELYVENGRGRIGLTATDTTRTTVEITGRHADEFVVEQHDDRVAIIAPRRQAGFFAGSDTAAEITVTAPAGSRLVVKAGSAAVVAHGAWGDARIKSGSGDVAVEEIDAVGVVDTGSGDITIDRVAGDLRVKSGSGDVRLTEAGGTVVISTGSGDVRVDSVAGPTVVKTGSGDLHVVASDGDVSLSTGSGDLLLDRIHRGKVTVKGASGDVLVGVPAGTPVWTDVSTVTGRISSDLVGAGQPAEGQDHVEVRATLATGDIVLQQR